VFDSSARRPDGIPDSGRNPEYPTMAAQASPAVLLDMLAGWLPQQRWFPGRGVGLSELAIVSDVGLRAGDPALRHLIVEAALPSGAARFQVLVGYRTQLPPPLMSALIGLQDGVACYDALHDPELADELLRGISEQRMAGQVRFVREQDAAAFEPGSPAGKLSGLSSRVLGAEQSNTSLVFGDQVILKVLRRLFPGANPDLEVADALARLGSPRVAAPRGWIETDVDGEPVLLAVLSEFLSGAADGWTLALAQLHRLQARHGAYGQEYLTGPVPAGGPADAAAALPFTTEAGQLGQATAGLHADMARAFGSRAMTAAELTGLAADLNGKLSAAITAVPLLQGFEAKIRSAYAGLADLRQPVSVQRIHGDYHLGQVLLGEHGWVALDFEGEPAVPLAIRRAPAPALRDVAGMLRSFDYAARHQLVGHPEPGPAAAIAADWVRQCQAAFCAGYAAGGGADPAGHHVLLRALTLEKAVYEVVYEHRHRPSWLPIPLDYVAAA
jgi:maltokinase